MKYLMLFVLLLPLPALSAIEVQVNWLNPDGYSDIRGAGESRERFRKRLFRNLEEHLQKLGDGVERDGRLEISVTDLDLAGRVEIGGHGEARVITEITPARIRFEYRLVDASGQLVKEGNEKLMGGSSSLRSTGSSRNEPFAIEKALFTRWFRKAVATTAEPVKP